MPQELKPDFNVYSDWFKTNFGTDLYSQSKQIYEYVSQKLQRDFENSGFWIEFQKNLQEYNDEYYLSYQYSLIKIEKIPLHLKTYESVINKSYRKNILLNEKFPDPPQNGWVTPDNWFTSIKDIIRTTIVVRYLDGVEFLAKKIEDLCTKHKTTFIVDYEAREDGYYAAHITVIIKLKIVDSNWSEKEINFPIEIQLTTQLQEVIKGLLHKMYEELRIKKPIPDEMKWQWNYKSQEFSSNYLGHILHYVEGMILEVRDKQNNKKK